jgi:quercetin dioxygenase-like cupin family protein
MADVTVRRTEDFEAIFGGGMLKARAGLGLTSFGMQILRFPPDTDRYPEHDHSSDGQEEVYTVLDGAVTLLAGGEEHRLEPGVFARVGPTVERKLVSGEEGATVLVLGGVPGRAFEPAKFTDEGEPDPSGGGDG